MSQQEVSGKRASEVSSVFTAAPRHLHYCLSSVSCQISDRIRFSWERNSTVNCGREGSRLHAPYENLMPDNLILHCGKLCKYFM